MHNTEMIDTALATEVLCFHMLVIDFSETGNCRD